MKTKCILLILTLALVMTSALACQSEAVLSETTATQDISEPDTPHDETTAFNETQSITEPETLSFSEEHRRLKVSVYNTLDKINFSVEYFLPSFPIAALDEDLYETYFIPLGKEAVPYILQYVMESSYSVAPENWNGGSFSWEQEFFDCCYFVAAAYALIDKPHFLIDNWYGYEPSNPQKHAPWIPRYYASQLYEHLPEHIDSDPAYWGTYTPAEGSPDPADGAMALKAKVYAVLDTVNFDKTRFVHHSYFPRIGLDNEADLIYETYIQPLGIEAIPYILQYVLESPYSKLPEGWSTLGGDWPWIQEFWDSCYFVASAYALLDIPHSQDWYGYTDWYTEEEAFYTVRLFASQLYEHLPEHIDSDPAYWGTYTPAEGAPDPDETLPPVIYTDPKV